MSKLRFFILSILLGLILFSTIGSTYATWLYTSDIEISSNIDFGNVSLNEFIYKPEEVLPGDEADDISENHLFLIQNILDEKDKGYGINATKKPVIVSYLNQDGKVLYSTQNVQGGNLRHVLIDNTEAGKLRFVLYRESQTEFHAYTYSESQVSSTDLGERVEVYKTHLLKGDDGWYAERSYYGSAVVARISVAGGDTIDIFSWTRNY